LEGSFDSQLDHVLHNSKFASFNHSTLAFFRIAIRDESFNRIIVVTPHSRIPSSNDDHQSNILETMDLLESNALDMCPDSLLVCRECEID
jgi:hypothetical protein